MGEKKIHWKTAKKLAEQNSDIVPQEVQSEEIEQHIQEQPIQKSTDKGKTQWTVTYQER